MKKYITLVIVLATYVSLSAQFKSQRIKVGVSMGANFSDYHFDYQELSELTIKNPIAPNWELTANYDIIRDKLGIEIGLGTSALKMGYKFDSKYQPNKSLTKNYKTKSIVIPLRINWTFLDKPKYSIGLTLGMQMLLGTHNSYNQRFFFSKKEEGYLDYGRLDVINDSTYGIFRTFGEEGLSSKFLFESGVFASYHISKKLAVFAHGKATLNIFNPINTGYFDVQTLQYHPVLDYEIIDRKLYLYTPNNLLFSLNIGVKYALSKR